MHRYETSRRVQRWEMSQGRTHGADELIHDLTTISVALLLHIHIHIHTPSRPPSLLPYALQCSSLPRIVFYRSFVHLPVLSHITRSTYHHTVCTLGTPSLSSRPTTDSSHAGTYSVSRRWTPVYFIRFDSALLPPPRSTRRRTRVWTAS